MLALAFASFTAFRAVELERESASSVALAAQHTAAMSALLPPGASDVPPEASAELASHESLARVLTENAAYQRDAARNGWMMTAAGVLAGLVAFGLGAWRWRRGG
jgi:hypothetical protein